ncbi:MAG: hypothetical protein DWI22_04470, partial [Planctomycetota bacterium]
IAVNGIGNGNAIETNITQLEASNTTAGLIEITEVAAGTDIALGAVNNGTRDVIITAAAGAITDGNGATLNITAGTATLNAVNGIGSGDAIETYITQLKASNTGFNNIQIIESNGLKTGALSNLGAGGNSIEINVLTGDLEINMNVTCLDGNVSSEETILLVTQTGKITLADNITISTDDDPTAGQSSVVSGDRISLNASSGTGTVTVGVNVVIRTDGGVATHFYDRVAPSLTGTSLFVWNATTYSPSPVGGVTYLAIPSLVQKTGVNEFTVTFQVTIGVPGSTLEENLRMDIDWRDPTIFRVESLYLNAGTQTISHIYTNADFLIFLGHNKPIFFVDFSVSQHQSIQVVGGTLIQDGSSATKADGMLSTTDLDEPAPNINGPFANPINGDPNIVVDDIASNNDYHFDDGLVKIVIPTVILAPIVPDPPRLAPLATPVVVFDPVVTVLVHVAAVEVAEMPFSFASTQSQDYFQLRDGVTGDVIPNYEHITDEFGELLLQPTRLRQWVTEEKLQDQTELELWLITTKHTGNGAVTVERPVLKFDIADGRPFPARELMPEVFEDLKLLPIPLDGNLNDPSTPIPEDSAAPIDDQSLDTESQPQDEDNNHLSADGQSQFIPSDTERGDTESDDYPTVTGASGAGRSILISVVVAAVLNKSRVTSIAPSKSRLLLNRILNRQS